MFQILLLLITTYVTTFVSFAATPSIFVLAITPYKRGWLLIDMMPEGSDLMLHVGAWPMAMMFFGVLDLKCLFGKFF